MSTIDCRSNRAASSPDAIVAFHASRRCIRYRADASTGEIRGAEPVLPQGRKAACRSTPGWASHDFADATCRAGASAPRSRASTPTMASGLGSHGSAMPPPAISSGSGK